MSICLLRVTLVSWKEIQNEYENTAKAEMKGYYEEDSPLCTLKTATSVPYSIDSSALGKPDSVYERTGVGVFTEARCPIKPHKRLSREGGFREEGQTGQRSPRILMVALCGSRSESKIHVSHYLTPNPLQGPAFLPLNAKPQDGKQLKLLSSELNTQPLGLERATNLKAAF